MNAAQRKALRAALQQQATFAGAMVQALAASAMETRSRGGYAGGEEIRYLDRYQRQLGVLLNALEPIEDEDARVEWERQRREEQPWIESGGDGRPAEVDLHERIVVLLHESPAPEGLGDFLIYRCSVVPGNAWPRAGTTLRKGQITHWRPWPKIEGED